MNLSVRSGGNSERDDQVFHAACIVETIKENIENDKKVRYACGEMEHLEEGNIHWQFYIEYVIAQRMTYTKNISPFLQGAHLEIAMGSENANKEYCSKENNGTFWEYKGELYQPEGERPKNQWDRTKGIPAMIKQGKSYEEIREAYPATAMQFENGIKKWIAEKLQKEHKTWDGQLTQKNLWIWGPRGTGKTKKAVEDYGGPVFNKALNKWWDGYIEGMQVVLLDDWDQTHKVLASHLKKWGDRYPFIAEVKNGAIAVNPGNYRLIVTSNYSIEECFENKQDQEAIRRRFHVIHMTELREHE